MNESLFTNIHSSFENAYLSRTYINYEKRQFKTGKLKQMRLSDVFSKSVESLESNRNFFIGRSPQEKSRQITNIQTLLKDGQNLYNQYDKTTTSWLKWGGLRTLLKAINAYAPAFLKRYFPRLFTNRIAEAEASTQAQYSLFREKLLAFKALNEATVPEMPKAENVHPPVPNLPTPPQVNPDPVPNLKPIQAHDFEENSPSEEDPSPSDFLKEEGGEVIEEPKESPKAEIKPEPESVSPIAVELQKLDLQEVHGKAREMHVNRQTARIKNHIKQLEKDKENPPSWVIIKQILGALTIDLFRLQAMEKEVSLSEFLEIDKSLLSIFLINVSSKNDQEILDLYKDTDWKESFEKAFKKHLEGELIISKLPNNPTKIYKFKSPDGNVKGTNSYKDFIGHLQINEGAIADFKELHKSLKCSPTTLAIKFEENNKSLSGDLARVLIQLKAEMPFISLFLLPDLEQINFKDMNLSPNEEKAFIQLIPFLHCRNLNQIQLSDPPKNNLTTEDFNALLDLVPNFKFYLECCKQAPESLAIPPLLVFQPSIDLSGFSLRQSFDIMVQMINLQEVTLDCVELNNELLSQLVKSTLFKNLQNLKIKSPISSLTTNVIADLVQLPKLNKLKLPPLKQGSIPLKNLPKFDSPFKIDLFYVKQPLIRPFCRQLYTGPSGWASLFQIRSLKEGETNIFSSQDIVLGPDSVANWLLHDHYKKLSNDPNPITTLLADYNTLINDENILEFISKFPNTQILSLYHCPFITDVGVRKIIDYLPKCKIQKLDLSFNPQITWKAIVGKNRNDSIEPLSRLSRLVVSGTQITEQESQSIPAMKDKISCKKLILKITNDQLTDENALENLLKNQVLRDLLMLDFEGCTNLTNTMLEKVLVRLNDEDVFIDHKTGKKTKNPQRLNLSCLNLKGCLNITEEPFFDGEKEGVKKIKHLDTLCQIVSGGTQISEALKMAYSTIVFQENYAFIRYDTSNVQEALSAYLQEQTDEVLEPNGEKEGNIKILFRDIDPKKEAITFNTFRDILYSQSAYFRDLLKKGLKLALVAIESQHAKPEPVKALISMLKGENTINNFSWKTLTHTAELAKCLRLPSLYQHKLILRIRELFEKQFNWRYADDMLLTVGPHMLNDAKARQIVEDKLEHVLKTEKELKSSEIEKILGTARSHVLQKVIETCDLVIAKKKQQDMNGEMPQDGLADLQLTPEELRMLRGNNPARINHAQAPARRAAPNRVEGEESIEELNLQIALAESMHR